MRKILIVEDNLENFMVLEEQLHSLLIDVAEIENCGTLKDSLNNLTTSEELPDLIFLDLNLPDSNGLNTFEKVREIFQTEPIIILSGNDDKDLALEAIKGGAQDYLVKGDYNLSTLLKSINYSIERQRTQLRLDQEKQLRQRAILQATIDGQDKERERVGNQLHENITPTMATIKLLLKSYINNNKLQDDLFLNESIKNLVECIEDVRKIAKSMLPPLNNIKSFEQSIHDIANITSTTGEIDIAVNVSEQAEKILKNEQLYNQIYRIIQHQLYNIDKHSLAKKAMIDVDQNNESLVVIIRDNGAGFDPSSETMGTGFLDIKQRTDLLNGKLSIVTSAGNGCTVQIEIPVP
ncbi:MAG: response regulator [Ginsengibacter sp.]